MHLDLSKSNTKFKSYDQVPYYNPINIKLIDNLLKQSFLEISKYKNIF